MKVQQVGSFKNSDGSIDSYIFDVSGPAIFRDSEYLFGTGILADHYERMFFSWNEDATDAMARRVNKKLTLEDVTARPMFSPKGKYKGKYNGEKRLMFFYRYQVTVNRKPTAE